MMNRMKKLASMLLALVMVLAMAAPAMAATVTNNTTHSYKAYQIFSGTQAESEGQLGDIVWGNGVDNTNLLTALKEDERFGEQFDNCTTAADVAEVLADYQTNFDFAKAFANVVAAYLVGEGTVIAADATSTELANGYYLIVDTTDVSGKNDAKNSALLEVTSDITIEKKYEVPQVEKKIVEGEELVDSTNTSIGDVVDFKLTGTLPTNYTDYETYKYVFHDTLSAGLTFNNDVKVYVVNGDTETEIDASKYNVTENSGVITVAFDDLKTAVPAAVATSKIVVKYSATLDEDAVIGTPGNPNTVKLEYSNDPNFDGDGNNDGEPDDDKTPPTGFTPEDTVVVYTTSIQLNKTDGTNALAGAKFKIAGESLKVVVINEKVYVEDEDGTYYRLTDGTYTTTAPSSDIDTSKYESTEKKYKEIENIDKTTVTETVVTEAWVDSTGKLVFEGLGEGTYKITELIAPAGYNLLTEPITIVISWNDTDGFSVTKDGEPLTANTSNVYEFDVVNNAGSTLPETGGAGTTVIYVVGGVLVLAAIVLLITRKRMGAEK